MTTTERSVAHPGRPTAVDRLDALLNARILRALNTDTEEDLRRWWRVKVDAKRKLAHLPAADVELCAARLVRSLGAAA